MRKVDTGKLGAEKTDILRFRVVARYTIAPRWTIGEEYILIRRDGSILVGLVQLVSAGIAPKLRRDTSGTGKRGGTVEADNVEKDARIVTSRGMGKVSKATIKNIRRAIYGQDRTDNEGM